MRKFAPGLGLCLVALAHWSQSADAQDTKTHAADETDRPEEIVVTGSRIARRNYSAPSPVVTLDALEMQLSGTTTIEDALNTLPQVIPDRDRSTNNGGGTASVNLRGLGRNRTLVMLNGRRFAASQISGAVDINNIPAALIERVEVVTGGASAVYGSDAVVGVVNFILDDEFDGVEVNAQYDITQEGDGQVFDLSIAAGMPFAGGRARISGFFNYNTRESILGGEREFTSVVISDDTETGELVEDGSSAVPGGMILFPDTIFGGVPVEAAIFNQDGTLRPAVGPDDLYNFAPDNYIQVPLDRHVAAAFLNFDINPGLVAFFEGLYARNKVQQQLAPSPVPHFGGISIDTPFLPPDSRQILRDSFDPDGDGVAELFLRRRMMESGSREFEDTRDVLRLLAGLDGRAGESWRWQAYYSYTDTDVDPVMRNAVSQSRFQQSLLVDQATGDCQDPSGGCVPANIFGAGNVSQAAADFLKFAHIEDEETVQEQIASLYLSGRLGELPAGSLGVAAGLEWRRLEAVFTPDPAFRSNDVVGARGFQPAIGATAVAEAYAEILVPLFADKRLAQYLSIEAGARISDYNNAGTVDTWKLGGEWIPLEGLRLRAMYQRAIRAPNILEMLEVPAEAIRDRFNAVTDLCSASRDPVGNGLTEVCVGQGMDPSLVGVFEAPDPNFVSFFTGGNPDLQPEESTSITVGLVAEPAAMDGLSIAIDYFDIEITDAIIDIEAGALAACFAIKDPNSNLCAGYVRDASGRIAEASNFPRNVAVHKSEGIDLELHYAIDTPSLALFDGAAGFDLAVLGTWYITNGSQSSPLTPFFDCAGYFGFTCAFSSFGVLPEFKTTTRLTYSSGPLLASIRWRWIDGLKNSEPFFTALFELPDPVLAIPEIGSRNYLDLSAVYGFTEKFSLYGGVHNALGTEPPLLAGAAPGPNTDPATYDVLGRRFFMGLTLRY